MFFRKKKEYKIGGGWGDSICWTFPEEFNRWNGSPKTKFSVHGWKQDIPKKGDLLVGKFNAGIITFKFLCVDRCRDPKDMFFGKVIPTNQHKKPEE